MSGPTCAQLVQAAYIFTGWREERAEEMSTTNNNDKEEEQS